MLELKVTTVNHEHFFFFTFNKFFQSSSFSSHAEMSDEGRYVMLTASEGCDPVNRLYICDLQKIDYQITGKNSLNLLLCVSQR